MDPVSHAASGAIALMALRSRPATAWALPLAALACASPDIDLVFCHSPLDVLLLHRGIPQFSASFWRCFAGPCGESPRPATGNSGRSGFFASA